MSEPKYAGSQRIFLFLLAKRSLVVTNCIFIMSDQKSVDLLSLDTLTLGGRISELRRYL